MRLENLIQQALVGAVIGNKWWSSLKYRIQGFAIKYSQQLALNRAKKAKSLEDRLSRAVERGGGSVAIDLAKGDLEREASERYKGFVVRNKLKRVPYEAVKCNAFICVRKSWESSLVGTSNALTPLRSACWDRAVRFVRLSRHTFEIALLAVQEFRNYLVDFPRLGEAEAASYEGIVTECEVRSALKQVGLNKSPGLDGLPYEVYLRMSHMFVPILTDVFNHWFAQGAIPGSITKGVITLQKKEGRHVQGGGRRLQAHNSA